MFIRKRVVLRASLGLEVRQIELNRSSTVYGNKSMEGGLKGRGNFSLNPKEIDASLKVKMGGSVSYERNGGMTHRETSVTSSL